MFSERKRYERERPIKLEIASDTLTFNGAALETGAETLGQLRRRMAADGYLYLPSQLDRDEVITARHAVARRLADANLLDPSCPVEDCIAGEGVRVGFMAEVARDNPELDKVLYDGPMMEFYRGFLGGEVRHFDYTWFRTKSPGDNGTPPHTTWSIWGGARASSLPRGCP